MREGAVGVAPLPPKLAGGFSTMRVNNNGEGGGEVRCKAT